MADRRRRRCDLAADVVEVIRASVRSLSGARGEVVLGRNCIEKAVFVSYSKAVASAFALAQGGAERRRSGLGVDVCRLAGRRSHGRSCRNQRLHTF